MNDEKEYKVERDYGCTALVQTLAIVGAFAIAACAFAFLGTIGMNRSEIAECHKWQHEAEEYPSRLYYITKWQKAQCDAHNITINATVK